MQFVKNGPDLPEHLLQAHEDGRVVLFCGAGISYSAGLPGFSGLVRRLYAALGVSPDPVQKAAIKAGQYDTAIGLLEGTFVGGREAVRKALVPILTPDLSLKEATTTHEAILTLGKCRDGHTRLITTNFDRLFEEAIALKKLSVESFQAPLLPVPKNRWDGLVYLHGLLRAAPTSTDLNRLVLSSGDFGLAYLTERWAARFASELFRNYVVCFVGYRRQLEDNQRLPTDLKIRFSTLCDVSIHKYRHARVLLAAHVITLFRVDPVWTKEHLLPLFDWKKGSGNARLVWEAFLWGPRLYYPLLKEIKASFLDTAQHYSDLGKHGDQYVALLTYAALDQSDTFSASELAAATKALPQEGLQEAAQTLTQALEGSGDQRASYWDHRIVRYFHDIWPKTQDKVSPSISRSFGRLCIAAREAFPVALKHLGPWIMSPASPDFLVHFLEEEKLCDRFPEPALDFLDRILSTLPNWVPPGLRVCLKEIAVADSTLVSDSRYIRIENYLRENGGGE